MNLDIDNIRNIISDIEFVDKIYNIESIDGHITGKVKISFEGLNEPLDFDFNITPTYPLRSFGSESIYFINKNLISYNHVMEYGNICLHTSHSTKLKEKLILDFNSLKSWIVNYYINNTKDKKYEHIVVNESDIDGTKYSYIFTDCDNKFYKHEYGKVELISLKNGIYSSDRTIKNFIIKRFKSFECTIKSCQWSTNIMQLDVSSFGFYYFIEDAPAKYGKFAYTNINELKHCISNDFLDMLHQFDEKTNKKNNGNIFPIFLGYKINKDEIHWQVMLFKIGSFPLIGRPEILNGEKTGNWYTELRNENIRWGKTKNASYKYFFGRGSFSTKLTEKKILIIGIGAVGSILAKTLTRCGCRYIDFVDYDIKEPENVCRSEYFFTNGVTDKTFELFCILNEISPFVECNHLYNIYFENNLKSNYKDEKFRKEAEESLNSYDLIFDCTTDNDLMYILDKLKLEPIIMNMSITNHAKEMVCAFYPNIYRYVNNQFSNVLKNDTHDLYEPTGCWNPTFKATYNDIDILVQIALKQLNEAIDKKGRLNNFVITQENNSYKIIEY